MSFPPVLSLRASCLVSAEGSVNVSPLTKIWGRPRNTGQSVSHVSSLRDRSFIYRTVGNPTINLKYDKSQTVVNKNTVLIACVQSENNKSDLQTSHFTFIFIHFLNEKNVG